MTDSALIQPLVNYLHAHATTALSESDLSLLRDAIVPRRLRKRQYLLQEGDVCKFFGFIVKGSTRQYTVDVKGDEHILNLCIENWWTSDRESFQKNTPTIYNIDAWEETDLLLLPKEQYDRVNMIPAFQEMRMQLDDNYHMASQRRILSSMNETAESRYEALQKLYPEFMQRFPQHIIASYLGITKETLSRIRNQSVRKLH